MGSLNPFRFVRGYIKDTAAFMKHHDKSKRLFNLAMFILGFNLAANLLSLLIEEYLPQAILEKVTINDTVNTVARIMYHTLHHPLAIFFQHIWIELLSAIIVYQLLEDTLHKHEAVPRFYKPKLLSEIFLEDGGVYQTTQELLIFDVSIYNFLHQNGYEKFKKALKEVFKSSKEASIKILLLHPDIYLHDIRAKDFPKQSKILLNEMKEGLGLLHNFLEELKQEKIEVFKNKTFEIKLYRTSPIVSFIAWDEKIIFTPPFGNPDKKKSFLMSVDTTLGKDFKEYFTDLWSSSNTIALEKYLFATISHEQTADENILWGPSFGETQVPRYIMSVNEPLAFKRFFLEKKFLTIKHNGNTTHAKLKACFENDTSTEFEFAKNKIIDEFGKTICRNCRQPIYELEYLSEKGLEIKLTDASLVKRNLIKSGFSFISHKQYDINLNHRVSEFISRLHFVTENFLEIDKYDVDIIRQLRMKDKDYKSNPRKRLFLRFNCTFEKYSYPNIVCDETATEYDLHYGIHKSNENRGQVKTTNKRSYRSIAGLRKQFETNPEHFLDDSQTNDLNVGMHSEEELTHIVAERKLQTAELNKILDDLLLDIHSIIAADIFYIYGEEGLAKKNSKYVVDANIIRTYVCSEENGHEFKVAAASPRGKTNTDREYQVIHLIDRRHVYGGVTQVSNFIDGKTEIHEEALLKKPMDSAYFPKTFGKRQVLHSCSDIVYKDNDEKAQIGYRDVLILEITQLRDERSTGGIF